jgi:hypothetical protein
VTQGQIYQDSETLIRNAGTRIQGQRHRNRDAGNRDEEYKSGIIIEKGIK